MSMIPTSVSLVKVWLKLNENHYSNEAERVHSFTRV